MRFSEPRLSETPEKSSSSKIPPFYEIIDNLNLSQLQKDILRERYVKLITEMTYRAYVISVMYHLSHTIVTVGSLIVPALLSIQYMSPENQVYWVTWVTSLLVTTSNGLLTLFKVDKKYIFLHTYKEHLISEGWQYACLSGRYSGFNTPGKEPTHENQYVLFCHTIEKIKMRNVEDEYNRLHNPDVAVQSKPTDKGANPIIPVTPLNPLVTGPRLSTIMEEARQDETRIDTTRLDTSQGQRRLSIQRRRQSIEGINATSTPALINREDSREENGSLVDGETRGANRPLSVSINM
jgi:hypothetical protein